MYTSAVFLVFFVFCFLSTLSTPYELICVQNLVNI